MGTKHQKIADGDVDWFTSGVITFHSDVDDWRRNWKSSKSREEPFKNFSSHASKFTKVFVFFLVLHTPVGLHERTYGSRTYGALHKWSARGLKRSEKFEFVATGDAGLALRNHSAL